MKDGDAEAGDHQSKKTGSEDFSREEEDVESQYSLDDETILTKAGTISTWKDGQKLECDRLLTHWRKVFSEVLVSGDKNFLRCDVLSADLCDVPSDFGQICFEW